MQLTDKDMDVLDDVVRGWVTNRPIDLLLEHTYLAGKRAGREDMRERAAKACMEFLHDPWCCAGSCAEAIRALGVDDE